MRFASENELAVVPGSWLSASAIACETPPRRSAHVAHVTAAHAGAYSGEPLVYTAGSGTFLLFAYDDSAPGCQGCTSGFQAALPAAMRVREAWSGAPAAGPHTGGTPLLISAGGLVAPDASNLSDWFARVPEGLYWPQNAAGYYGATGAGPFCVSVCGPPLGTGCSFVARQCGGRGAGRAIVSRRLSAVVCSPSCRIHASGCPPLGILPVLVGRGFAGA